MVLKLVYNGYLFSYHVFIFLKCREMEEPGMDYGIHNFELHAFRAAFQRYKIKA